MRTRLLLLPLMMLTPASAALVPGAWESFSTQTNADAWNADAYYYDAEIDDWMTELFYPGWDDDVCDPDDACDPSTPPDPYIGFTMSEVLVPGEGGEDDELRFYDSVYLYANEFVASGAFTGDYAAAGVESISMDVYLEDPTLIDYFDVAIRSDVGGVDRYYFTDSFVGDSFSQPGWYALDFAFSEPWYWRDPTIEEDGEIVGGWVEVTLSDTVLSNIIEIGITFYHVVTNTTSTDVAIDNVALNHAFFTPEMAVGVASGMATFTFQKEPLHLYAIEKFNPASEAWEEEAGQTGISGVGLHSYETAATGTGIFRCVGEPEYTEVVTLPPS